jgi:hypothetical protein
MSQRTGLIISVVLTAFILFVGGAIVGRTTGHEETPAEQGSVKVLLERESAYQDLASQANERLQQAYAKLQVQAQVQATDVSPVIVLSPEQVTNIALQIAPGAVPSSPPEMVNFQGTLAYKITLNTGIVYIDPNSGVVLYNGVISQPDPGSTNNSETLADRYGGGKEGGGENESGGDHGGDD